MIALLSTSIPNLVIQDAHASTGTTSYTAVIDSGDSQNTIRDSGDRLFLNFAAPLNVTAGGTMTNAELLANFTSSGSLLVGATATWANTVGTDSKQVLRIEIDGNGGAVGDTITYNLNAAAHNDGGLYNQGSVLVGSEVFGTVVSTTGDFGLNGSSCNDCTPPKVRYTEIQINSGEKIITTGDEQLHITANVGDEISVLLKITDNMSIDTIPFVGLYTDYVEMPDDMPLFYSNNFDNLKNISTSFYEWNIRSDDVAYNYDGTVSWSNDPNVTVNGEYLMVPFTFTINEHMQTSQITAKIYDVAGNRLHVTLPVTLQTAGNDPLNFNNMGKQKMLGFFDESVLSIMISELNGSEDTAPLSTALGIPDESLPMWTLDLATWVAEDKIDSADLIIAAEYLINQ